MTDEDKPRDKSKRTRKDKKIIDVLMDDGEWRRKKKFKKEKKEQSEPQPKPRPETEPTPEDKTEPEIEPTPQREYRSDSEDRSPAKEHSRIETGSGKAEERTGASESEKSGAYLSEIERNVLREIVMGASSVNDIVRATNYPEVIVKGAIERLVSKDFIDGNLNPTEKIRGVSLKRGKAFTVGRKRRYRLGVLDVAIIVAILLFMVSLVYYMGFLG